VSRIEEALRRSQSAPANDEPATVLPSQALFRPAWSVATAEDAPATEDRSAPAESQGLEPILDPAGSSVAVSFSSAWRDRLASAPHGHPGLVEQFRRLAATLHHAHQANGIRSVMVSSARPGDGKTLTAVNLALVLAESYRYNVLLIDADLRRPSIPSAIDLGEGAGLSEALRASTEQKLTLVPVAPRLSLLPAGQPIANSIEALTSPRMRQILTEAVARYDWVILDAPPVGPTTDARLLTQMVDGTLFVVHAGQTQYPDVLRAIDSLGRERILGVVLNGVAESHDEGYYGLPRQDRGR